MLSFPNKCARKNLAAIPESHSFFERFWRRLIKYESQPNLAVAPAVLGDGPAHGGGHTLDTQSIIGLVIWFLAVLYSSMSSSTSSSASALAGANQVD